MHPTITKADGTRRETGKEGRICIPEGSRQVVSDGKLRSGVLSIFVDNDSLLRGTDSQNAGLRRVDDGSKVLDAKHTQVGNSEGTGLKKQKS